MRILPAGLMCLFALNAHANVLQYFTGISYNNPSELFKIKESTFLIGGTGFYADLKFTGSVLNFNTLEYGSGVGHSRTYTVLPYGRIAKRLNEKAVFAIDVTEPFNSNLNWGNEAFTRYANTQNYLLDVDVSPKISYELTKQLQVGGGLNFNFLRNNEVNWAFPTGQFTSDILVNKSSSFGLGFNLGATYIINQTNFLGLIYYSKIKQNTDGYSKLGSRYSNNYLFSFNMPATTILSYTHIFNPSWLVSMQLFQSQWDANQFVRLFNTAAPPPNSDFVFQMGFSKSYAYLLAVRNQFNEKLGLTLAGMIDDGPERDNLRTITFPSDTQYFIGLVGDYHFTPKTSMELLYGHVFSNTSIQNRVTINNASIPFTTGKVNINANVIDLKLKIEM
ncbi:MAG TPA: outer membrane protein transport protein [Legionella sp.]|nr:outer membrane protein transport protein [Legionella sp.]